MKTDETIPSIVSIGQMCKLLSLSRARFYSLISVSDASKCFFLPPIYSMDTKRPYYTKDMAQQNINFKRNGTGYNQKILLFYNPRHAGPPVLKNKLKTQGKSSRQSGDTDRAITVD